MAHQAGRHDTAIELIGQAVRLRGDDAFYHQNLGLALQAQARLGDAAACFERALGLKPDLVKAHNNLGVVRLAQGKPGDAVTHFERALTLAPNYAAAHVNIGNALKALGKLDRSVANFERALAIEPNLAEAHFNLGVALIGQGRIDEAFAAYRRHAAALRSGAGAQAKAAREPVPPHKARHDREQLEYLVATRPDGEKFRQARETAARAPGSFAEVFDNLFHLEGGAHCAAAAVNPALDTAEIEARWEKSRPKIVIVDDFLTSSALEELRRFYRSGYLGSFFADGFACLLLGEIAAGLAAKLPLVFRKHRLTQMWGFKYDNELRGITVHADTAAVNVNFWITPDEANLDPQSGGLVIWGVAAPLDWAFEKYQNNDPRDILHRRALPLQPRRHIRFGSVSRDRSVAFKEGYLNRRINITMLYGLRHDDGEG